MKRSLALLLVAAGMLLAYSSCKKDDNDNVDKVEYTLTIDNQTSENLDIYLSSNNGSSFTNKGTALSNAELSISKLYVSDTYVLRATLQGDDVDNHVLEETFSNNDPNVGEYVFTITE